MSKGTRVDLDVVIVTYNSGALLADVVGHLPDDVNVIIVDNASRDDSIDVARDLGLQVLARATNTGFAAATNRGAARGSAEFILFLNPDAVVEPHAIERLLKEFDDPTVAVVSPRLIRPDGTPQRTRWPFPSSKLAWQSAFAIRSEVQRDPDEQFVVGAVFMCRRSAFESVSGFDERFWLYGEETDLCRRLRNDGWSLRLVSEVTATHIGKASWKGDHSVAGEHRRRGDEHFIAKHEGRAGLLSYRLARIVDSTIRLTLQPTSPHWAHHRQRLRDTLGTLARSPVRVPVDSPVTRVPGAGIVAFGLEHWGAPDQRLQRLLRQLLQVEPERRVLFVEPTHVPIARLWSPSAGSRRAGLRPVASDGRIVRFQPLQLIPFRTGTVNQWLVQRQVKRALRLFGLDGPCYVIEDPGYLVGAQAWGVPIIDETHGLWPPNKTAVEVDGSIDSDFDSFRRHIAAASGGDPEEKFKVVYLSHRADLDGNSFAMTRLLSVLPEVDAHAILGQHGPVETVLRAGGASVEVMSISDDLFVPSRRARLGNRLGREKVTSMLAVTRQLTDRLRQLQPDLIHTTTVTSAIIGGIAGRRAKIPVVWQIREGVNHDNMSGPAILALRLAGRVIPDAILANSPRTWAAMGLTRRGPMTASRIVEDLVESVDVVERSTGHGPITVAIVAKLAPWKGQQVFLDAFAKAFAGTSHQALIVGPTIDQQYEAELHRQVVELGIVEQVTFTGFVSDISQLLNRVDVLVHATLQGEPFSQIVLAGMASGLPVVASDAGGAARFISHGMDGLICPSSDVSALAQILQLLAGDPELRRRLGEAARRRSNEYRPEVVAGQVLRAYRQVVIAARHRR